MIQDKLIYTDGHSVVVTGSTLKVRNAQYVLKGVTRYGLSIVQPARIPGLSLLVTGMLLVVAGAFKFIPLNALPTYYIGEVAIGVNTLAVWMGIIVTTLGLNVNLMLKKKYAVRIATAMGEKNVIVSHEREYISQIVNALDRATGPVAA